jgi:hypothetical protein
MRVNVGGYRGNHLERSVISRKSEGRGYLVKAILPRRVEGNQLSHERLGFYFTLRDGIPFRTAGSERFGLDPDLNPDSVMQLTIES